MVLPTWFSVAAFLIAAIAAFSKTVRAEIRRFLTRNFHRSKYDYRAQWLQVTEAFQQAARKDAIMDRLLDLLIKTFATTTISIWSFREADRQFCRIRSMTAEKEPVPIELSHPVIVQLLEKDEPVLIEEGLARRSDGATSAGDPLAASGSSALFPDPCPGGSSRPSWRWASNFMARPMERMIAICFASLHITSGLCSLTPIWQKNARPRLNWRRCIGSPCSVCMT